MNAEIILQSITTQFDADYSALPICVPKNAVNVESDGFESTRELVKKYFRLVATPYGRNYCWFNGNRIADTKEWVRWLKRIPKPVRVWFETTSEVCFQEVANLPNEPLGDQEINIAPKMPFEDLWTPETTNGDDITEDDKVVIEKWKSYFSTVFKQSTDEETEEIVNYMLHYLSALRKGKQTKVILRLIGGQGIGKSTIAKIVKHLIGDNAINVNAEQVLTYNHELEGKMAFIFEEQTPRNKQEFYEELKKYATEDTMTYRQMYSSPRVGKNNMNPILMSNHYKEMGQDNGRRVFSPPFNTETKGNAKFWTEQYETLILNEDAYRPFIKYLNTLPSMCFDFQHHIPKFLKERKKKEHTLIVHFLRQEYLFNSVENPSGEAVSRVLNTTALRLYKEWIKWRDGICSHINKFDNERTRNSYNNPTAFHTQLASLGMRQIKKGGTARYRFSTNGYFPGGGKPTQDLAHIASANGWDGDDDCDALFNALKDPHCDESDEEDAGPDYKKLYEESQDEIVRLKAQLEEMRLDMENIKLHVSGIIDKYT